MSMVCGLDMHRGQITFDVPRSILGRRGAAASGGGTGSGCGRGCATRWRDEVAPRAGGGPVAIAVEGCTGWRDVVEAVRAAGFEAHVAEPADTQAMRGRKRHAKTDRSNARL